MRDVPLTKKQLQLLVAICGEVLAQRKTEMSTEGAKVNKLNEQNE